MQLGHSPPRLASKDPLLDAQLLRLVGTAPYGGADIGESLAAARRVRGTDLGSWYDEWTRLGTALLTIAAAAEEAGQRVTARGAYFRAANALRTAGVMLMGPPIDPRFVDSVRQQTDAFRLGAALLDRPPAIVSVPFLDIELPGYFFHAGGAGPAPTLILVNGYDGTAEELYFANAAAAVARGYHVLAVDGPGQGALLAGGIPIRHDWETVVAASIDWLLSRPEVDETRLVLMGLSLGAHLAPRAAAFEHRVAACIADCGSFDLHAAALERIPSPLMKGYTDPASVQGTALTKVLGLLSSRPTAGWALRRGMLVHGVDTPLDYLRSLEPFSLEGVADRIECPTLVCHAEDDDISASAPLLAAAIGDRATLVRFTRAEGAGDHCEAGARTLFHARAFDWLESVLPLNR